MDKNVTGGERDDEDGLGNERVMDDILRAGDDREKTGMTEDDIDNMAKADDNAELGMRECMK